MKVAILGYASVGKNLESLFKNVGYTTIIGVRPLKNTYNIMLPILYQPPKTLIQQF